MTVDELEELTASIYKAAAIDRVDELRAAVQSVDLADGESARAHAVVGGAWLVIFKLSHDPEDLAVAIPHLERAQRLAPTPARAANLAAALLERAGLPGRGDDVGSAADHAAALALLEHALADTPNDDERWIRRATILLGALLDAVDRRLDGADLDRALELGELLVAVARERENGGGEPQNLLGGAHISAAMLGHPAADLTLAVELLHESIAALQPAHPDRASRLSNLGAALLDRYERDGAEVDLAEAVVVNADALAVLPEHDLNRPLVANNLLNALVASYRLTGSEEDVRAALSLASLLEHAFHPGDSLYPVARSNLGNAEEAAFALWRDRDHLERAIQLQREAIAASVANDPSLAGRRAALGVALGHRFHEDGDRADLDEALAIGLEAVQDAGGPSHEIARYVSNLGNLLHDRYLRTGRIADLDHAARLHLDGLGELPDANPALSGLLNNAGITLSDRFDRLRDPDDLDAAISALSRAVAETSSDHRELAGRLVNLAVAHHRRYMLSGDDADLSRGIEEASAAVEGAVDEPTRAAALGTLLDLVRTRWDESREDGDRRWLGQLLERESLLSDAGRRPAQPTRLLRRALLARTFGEDRLEGLREAAHAGLELRPQIALAAGRQLAADGLSLQVEGADDGDAIVAEGIGLAEQALALLGADAVEARHVLAWQREAAGVTAIAAHSRLLLGEADAALAAFERGYATLLGARLSSARPSEAVVCCWATAHGGGAIIEHNGDIESVVAPQLSDERILRWRRGLTIAARLGERVLTPMVERVVRELGEILIASIADDLEPGEPVVWCSGGLLAMLPVTAAPIAEGRLLDRHPLRFAATPGIAGWAERLARERAIVPDSSWSLAAPTPSALAPLSYAAAEGAAFAPPARRLVGQTATVAAAVEAIESGSLVHFACHGRTSARDPLANHLLLAGDEPLFADDVIRLDAPGRLVVLAACDTADIGVDHADEGLGLASAFHASGVPGVVASLWPVYDEATSDLMRVFARLLDDGLSPADALRGACRSARDTGAPPGAWAAFVLQGC